MSSRTVTAEIPVGTIVPIASNLTGAYSIPASGTVDSRGWMYCDGSAIPAGHTVSGTSPNLTDSRFIMGSTSSGSTGGVNTVNLQHSHTVNSHTHNIGAHTHTSPGHTHTLDAGAHMTDSVNDLVWEEKTGMSSWTHNHEVDAPSTTVSGASWTKGIKVSGTAQSTAVTVNASSAYASGSASPGTNNQLSSTQDNRPQYFTCQYIIKVS